MSKFAEQRILITGGLGFIGSNLAARLVKERAKVTLVDSLIPEYGGNLFNIEAFKDKVSVNISDVRDQYAMKYLIQGVDYLFNLAGQTSHTDSMENPFPDLEINARAQLSILEACRLYNPSIKIVFASTRQVYGKPQNLPVNESHPLVPVDVNGINKLAGEWYHLVYNNVYGIRTTVLRLTNTYGPRMRVVDARQTFLGIWIRRILEGQPLLVYGDGKQVRDFNYVDDVVEALMLAITADSANGEIFNLGAPQPISLSDAAELLVEASGSGSSQLVPFPEHLKKIDIGDYYGDYGKIQSRLGWKPKVSLGEGLAMTLEYYREYGKHYWSPAERIPR
jgi:UDP-glucose 4-epimerase